MEEVNVAMIRATSTSNLQHLRTRVDADHRTAGAENLDHVRDQERRSAPDIDDAVARGRCKRLQHKTSPPDDILRAIQRLESIGDRLVELHRYLPPYRCDIAIAARLPVPVRAG